MAIFIASAWPASCFWGYPTSLLKKCFWCAIVPKPPPYHIDIALSYISFPWILASVVFEKSRAHHIYPCSEKKLEAFQNPLYDKKGTVLYPMGELLKNGSAKEKMVLDNKKRFRPKPFFAQNHFFLSRTIFSCAEPFFRSSPIGNNAELFLSESWFCKPPLFFQSMIQYHFVVLNDFYLLWKNDIGSTENKRISHRHGVRI